MTFEAALRATEILLAFAFIQQSGEHLARPMDGRWLFGIRLAASLVLLSGLFTIGSLTVLAVISLIMLHRFNGPYNGGSDRMSILILWCLLVAHAVPVQSVKEIAIGYLALQTTLSYFISGQVKLVNPQWRSGRALREVFDFSAYPVSENLRSLAQRPILCRTMSWAVIVFEVLFPLALISQASLVAALVMAAAFHLANAFLFGLNRFFWIWIAAYPSLLWFQTTLLDALN